MKKLLAVLILLALFIPSLSYGLNFFFFGGGGIRRAVAYSTSSTITCFTSVLADTSGGAITITLPADPIEGCQIAIIDAAGTFATYNLTVERNSQKINGLSENLTLTVNNLHVGLVYYNATYGWRVLTY